MPQITKNVYDIIEIRGKGNITINNNDAYISAKTATSYYIAVDKAYWDSESWLSVPSLQQNRSEIWDYDTDPENPVFIGYQWTICRILLYWDISEIPDCGEITTIKMNYGIDHIFNPDNKLIFQVNRGESTKEPEYPHYPAQPIDFNESNYETINEFDLSDKGYTGYDPVSVVGDLITDETFINDLNLYPKKDIRLMLRMAKDVDGVAIERTIKMTNGSWSAPNLPEIIITWTERPEIEMITVIKVEDKVIARANITKIRCSSCDTRGFSVVFSQPELTLEEKNELELFFDTMGWDYYSTYYPTSGWWVDAWLDYEEIGSFGTGIFTMELGSLPKGFTYDIYAYCENEGGYASSQGKEIVIPPFEVITKNALKQETTKITSLAKIKLSGEITEIGED